MQTLLFDRPTNKTDVVYTPEWCAIDIISYFQPTGKILDPCRGEGAFYNNMPSGSFFCEIQEGIDFFEWTEKVDWIISNPPYSNFREWLRYSFEVAENIVYLIPLKNVFSAFGQLKEIYDRGGIKHIRVYGTGARLKFPMGNAVGAVHFKKDYAGDIGISFSI